MDLALLLPRLGECFTKPVFHSRHRLSRLQSDKEAAAN